MKLYKYTDFFNESLRDKMIPKSDEEIREKIKKIFNTDKDVISIKLHNPHGYKLVGMNSGIEEENYRVNYHKLTGDIVVIYNYLMDYLDKSPGDPIGYIGEFLIDDKPLTYKKREKVRNFENFSLSLPIEINNNNMENINERINAKMDIPQDIMDFQKLFTAKGHRLYIVGGAVRDFLMNKKPHDFDMATDTTPQRVMDILKDYRTDLQGVHFGVVRVFTEAEPEGYEIASYRKDIAKGRDNKGNNQKVEIGSHITIKDDVKRRDLTMNALFYDIRTGQIVDVVGGIKDINDKIVRAVGNPRTRFDEDRLRILRAIRFADVTHSKLERKTATAIKNDSRLFNISDVDDVSRERIFLEFKKVKEKARKNDDPMMIKNFVDMLIQYDIMEQIFPVITKDKSIKPTTYLTVAIAQVLRENDVTPEFKRILIDAKIPTDFVEIISILVELYRNGVAPENAYETWKTIRNKGLRLDILQEWIDVMGITNKSVLAMLKYVPTTSSKDIMDAGFTGAGIGNEIRKREAEKFNKLVTETN